MEVIYIYSEKKDLSEGIYGECITWLLEVLYHIKKNNKINDNTKIILFKYFKIMII